MTIIPVIMCGGAGTRMWPDSRESYPKQFLKLFGEQSTFQAVAGILARDPDAVVIVMAADHVVQDTAGLVAKCEEAARAAAKGAIVTLGIKPTHAETGYGYIRPGAAIGDGLSEVAAFVEKPDAATAETYVAQGYLWNSGNFVFSAATMRDEIAAFEPAMAQACASC